MALRWYTVVVDCLDAKAQAEWWAEALDWHKVYEADEEVVLLPPGVTAETAGTTPWEQQKTGMVFVKVPEHKTLKNRLHIDLAPHTSQDRDAEIERLLGARCHPRRRRPVAGGRVGRLRRSGGQRVLRAVGT